MARKLTDQLGLASSVTGSPVAQGEEDDVGLVAGVVVDQEDPPEEWVQGTHAVTRTTAPEEEKSVPGIYRGVQARVRIRITCKVFEIFWATKMYLEFTEVYKRGCGSE